MESADWSTSGLTTVKCIQGDIESALKPIVRALNRVKGDKIAHSVKIKLLALYECNEAVGERVFKDKVSLTARKLALLAAEDCPAKTSDKVHRELVAMIKPLVEELEQSKSRFVPHIVKALKKTYELRWYEDNVDIVTIRVNPRARSHLTPPANPRAIS